MEIGIPVTKKIAEGEGSKEQVAEGNTIIVPSALVLPPGTESLHGVSMLCPVR